MRRIVMPLIVLALVILAPSATLAQSDGEGSAPLTQADLDDYREVAAEAMAQIDAEIRILQEAIDDPDTVAVDGPGGPRLVHISHLPAALQLEALLLQQGRDDVAGRLGLWTWLDELGLLSESVFTPAGIGAVVRGLDQEAERRIEALLDEKAGVELFLGWLDQEPVALGPGDDAERAGDLASEEGPYLDRCIFRTGYPLDRSRFSETQVVAWRLDDFDPTWARFQYASATPDDEADDPGHRIERMRRDVAAIEDATVVFDGSFAGFCAWAHATCPGTEPLVASEPVCMDGVPVTD